jgi:hypothetical protein
MSTEIDWSKAPDDATHYAPETEELNPGFIKRESGRWMFYSDSELCRLNPGWSIASSDDDPSRWIERPTDRNGEGLPPVGVACEYIRGDVPHISQDWEKVIPLAFGSKLAFLRDVATGNEFTEKVCRCAFRPIRTQAQIEAEEREAAIITACESVEDKIAQYNTRLDCSVAIRATVEAMIDQGYRKQPTKQDGE